MTSFRPFALSLTASLLLGACSASSPLFYEPVNKVVQTDLPSLHTATGNQQSFSFRIITPVKNVDLFSVLQTTEPTFPEQQNTLPVAQLRAVQIAKEKITRDKFVRPEEATVLAFEAYRQFSFDPEIARLVLVEVVKAYSQHRDAELVKFRNLAETRAQFFIEKNRVAAEEYKRQSQAVIDDYFDGIPNPQTYTIDEQNKQRRLAFAYSQERLVKNKIAQDEYNKQAKAALAEYLTRLDEQTKKAREKEEKAQALRKAQFEQILANQKLAPVLETIGSGFGIKADTSPYSLMPLTNGDFMLEASQPLPAVIQLEVEPFTQPVSIPVLPQTSHGRLLISISSDAQGRPIVAGGMDASAGARFDLTEVLFTIQYDAQGRQMLEFLYPNGIVERLDIASLQNLQSNTALDKLNPEVSQLEALQLQQKHSLFSQVHYQLTPELEYLPPEQALQILEGVKKSF